MEYAEYSSELQRRLALRSKQITLQEFHRAAFLYLNHRKDVKIVNEELKELRRQQSTDKKLLRMTQEMHYMDVLMAQDVDFWEDSYND